MGSIIKIMDDETILLKKLDTIVMFMGLFKSDNIRGRQIEIRYEQGHTTHYYPVYIDSNYLKERLRQDFMDCKRSLFNEYGIDYKKND